MGSLVWPVSTYRDAGPRIWIGRVIHWALTAGAGFIVAIGVWVSASVLSEIETTHEMWPDDAVEFTVLCALLALVCLCVGRSLRYLVARE